MLQSHGGGSSAHPLGNASITPAAAPQARSRDLRLHAWAAAVLIATAPVVLTLFIVLWRTPFPVNEAVALFEDVAKPSVAPFLIPETSYYRPLFHVTLSAIWHTAGSLGNKLALIKLLHMGPLVLLVILLIWHLRPRSALDAAAAALAVAVLVAHPGFRDNLEIPLSYTAVGMPAALIVWDLVNRERRPWFGPVIAAVTLIAVGFKEQGLVIVPLVVAAWWTRAPGTNRRIVSGLVVFALAYVAFRLHWRGDWPLFEQTIGFGFTEMDPREAVARFGAFPYWIYAYSSASTVANVLFSEPSMGVFRVVRDARSGYIEPWEINDFVSSLALTILIVWWGVRSLRNAAREGWSIEARAFITLLVVLLSCGILSFDYSRDRMGGMAVVFYAIATFYALRAAAERVAMASRRQFVAAGVALMLLAGAWNIRAIVTLENTRFIASRNRIGWLIGLPERRKQFADRTGYLNIMESMVDQGTNPKAPRPTHYPHWFGRIIGQQPGW